MNEQVTRQILWNIPVPFIVLMYGLLGLLIVGFIYAGLRWYRLVTLGVADARFDHPVERLLLSRGIRLFWFDLYDRYFPTEQGQEGHVDVEDLVKKSGGIAVTADDATLTKGQEFNKLVSGIYDSMKNFYVLNVETPAGADDNHAWDLQVLDDQGKKLKGIWVFYPKRLPPCATTSLH